MPPRDTGCTGPEEHPVALVPRLALRPREAAAALGISEKALWSLTNMGLVPHIRLSERIVLYPIDGLRRWLDEQLNQQCPATRGGDAGRCRGTNNDGVQRGQARPHTTS